MSDEWNATGSCSGDCGSCGSDCGGNVDLNQPTVTLTLDDDREVTCAVINIFPENGQNTDGEVYLYRFYEDEHGNPNLSNIETEEEYQTAAAAFNEMMQAADLDETEEA